MEAINQDSIIAPGDLKEAPISLTSTEANLTGSWKFNYPEFSFKTAPCSYQCPLKTNIPGYLAQLAESNPRSALDILRRFNPLPAVTGRICPHFCQQDCNRHLLDQEVLIRAVEQFLGDFGLEIPFDPPKEKSAIKVAVIGSGPAGLSAAYFLAQEGIQVSIFEQEAKPGGLLRYGIPSHRLPKDILDKEVGNLFFSFKNITFMPQRAIPPKELPDLQEEFKAVICAPGLPKSIWPEEFPKHPGMYPGLTILRRIQQGFIPKEKQFAIIGGGNTAVDVARSLIRLGKEVQILYRRTRNKMPAFEEEINQALEEGIPLMEQVIVRSIENQGEALLLELARARSNSKGQISCGPPAGKILTQAVILAVGQEKDIKIPVQKGIKASGDYELGPSSVSQAMASGKKAARDVLKELRILPDTEALPTPRAKLEPINLSFVPFCPSVRLETVLARQGQNYLPPQTISQEQAVKEASRCLCCGICTGCGICKFFCPDLAITTTTIDNRPAINIDLQHCKGCGLCSSLCPRGMIQMKEEQ